MTLEALVPGDRIADSVYLSVRDAIFSGTLRAGDRLSVPALAGQLGVSRSPVREAVLRLTQDGLAREEPRRGAIVARIDGRELVRLYEVREVLEGLAARLAAKNDCHGLVADLERVVADHERAVEGGSIDDHLSADMRFHSLIRSASANPELISMLDRLQTRVRLAMLTTTVTAGPHRALDDHRSILQAIRSGNAELAEQRARAHIARLRETLAASFDGSLAGA